MISVKISINVGIRKIITITESQKFSNKLKTK
jgi:hypothetical protein